MQLADLQTRIWIFFYEFELSDTNIQLFLRKEGYDIEMKVMTRLGFSLGIQRRTERKDYLEHNSVMRRVLKEQLSSGQTVLYGRRLTYQKLKQRGILVARDRMFEVLRFLDPIGIAERPFPMQKILRGIYTVQGVNFFCQLTDIIK